MPPKINKENGQINSDKPKTGSNSVMFLHHELGGISHSSADEPESSKL